MTPSRSDERIFGNVARVTSARGVTALTEAESCPPNDPLQLCFGDPIALARYDLESRTIEDGPAVVPGVDDSRRLKAPRPRGRPHYVSSRLRRRT